MDKTVNTNLYSCSDSEYAIIAGTAESDPQARAHLQTCAACREFAGFQQMLLAAEVPTAARLPEFAEIRSAAIQQRKQRRRVLKFSYISLGAAAAAAVCIGGVFFNLPEVGSGANQLLGNRVYLSEPVDWDAFLEDSSIKMTWDHAGSWEDKCKDSLQAARRGSDQWSIELANFYSEEY